MRTRMSPRRILLVVGLGALAATSVWASNDLRQKLGSAPRAQTYVETMSASDRNGSSDEAPGQQMMIMSASPDDGQEGAIRLSPY